MLGVQARATGWKGSLGAKRLLRDSRAIVQTCDVGPFRDLAGDSYCSYLRPHPPEMPPEQAFQRAERRRSRTYPAWGCHASPVLKINHWSQTGSPCTRVAQALRRRSVERQPFRSRRKTHGMSCRESLAAAFWVGQRERGNGRSLIRTGSRRCALFQCGSRRLLPRSDVEHCREAHRDRLGPLLLHTTPDSCIQLCALRRL
jgi:hypothetical protein